MTDRFILTQIERESPIWRRIVDEYLETRLKRLRVENDAERSPDATAKLRGQIAEVKLMMGLDRDQPIVMPDKFDQF